MALDRSKPKPTVFLSFAGEDVEWKRTFMEPNWWAALTKVAEIRDYDNDPARYGDLYTSMAELVRQSAAFIVILSKFYLRKDGIIEHEFKTAADRFSASGRQDRFRAIIIDAEAREWWGNSDNEIFRKHEWLRRNIYWQLIEGNEPAPLTGNPRYARQVRDYAERLAKLLIAEPEPGPGERDPSPNKGSIIILGHPRPNASTYAVGNSSVVRAREELANKLRARDAEVSKWEDGWSVGDSNTRELHARHIRGPVRGVVRTLGADEALDAAVSPEITVNQLSFATKVERAEISKIKISLWLPSEHRNDPEAEVFVDNASKQLANANPRLYVAAVEELAELLAPSAGGRKITQISVEEIDDLREIEGGRTARKIVEDELRECFLSGARQANLPDIEPPLVRHFLNYQRLANQILEAKDGRIMLVAHDLQEHPAANNSDAHRKLGQKVRNLKESVESIVALGRRQLIPITLVVTNYENLRNDTVLDEEIAGIKWWLLSGQLKDGKFTSEPDMYERVVSKIATVLKE